MADKFPTIRRDLSLIDQRAHPETLIATDGDTVFTIPLKQDQVAVIHDIFFSYNESKVIGSLTVLIGGKPVLDIDVHDWGVVKKEFVSFGQEVQVILKGLPLTTGKLTVDFEVSE